MKKFFILASAAIVALASCAKTEVVYKDAPEEIAFKTVNMPMTKAAYDQDLGVAAFYHGTANPYFGVTQFTHDGTVWKGGLNWPLGDALDFVAYGPFTDCTTNIDVKNTGITATGVCSDVDFVYTELVNNNGAGYTKQEAAVPMLLKHAKSKINVNVVNGSNETVTAVTLLNAGQTGDCAIEFGKDPVWDKISTGNYDFSSVKTHYVIPGTPTKLQITYNSTNPAINGLLVDIDLAKESLYKSDDNSDYPADKGWLPGYSYTYNIRINSSEIIVSATAEAWIEYDNIKN